MVMIISSLTTPDFVLRFCTQSDIANQLQIISGSAPAVQPTNRGRAESHDVDAKRRI